MTNEIRIAAFYSFHPLNDLEATKKKLLASMDRNACLGTIIIAGEGFNGTVSGESEGLERFLCEMSLIFGVEPEIKFSSHNSQVFERRKVKIKPEIVTLKKDVDISAGAGTHLDSRAWNELISDPRTVIVDARNDYEYRVGTFKNAINPKTDSFSELPKVIEEEIAPDKETQLAVFCTGGIRCEKLAPYLVERGYKSVFQLEGGILKYLEETDREESLWDGECFVFDDRITVDHDLKKGTCDDFSQLKSLSQDLEPKSGDS
ncbi:MAG: rhodanese-like domain-containing protein [Pyrinomonadaceae bacterium]